LTALTTLGLAAPTDAAEAAAVAGAALGVLGLTGAATGAATAAEAVAAEEEEEEEEEDCLAILNEFICELVRLLFYTHPIEVCLSYFGT
jgi:hypothetical protein